MQVCVQAQLKDQLRDVDDLRAARDAAINSAKENERKLKSLEAENMQLHEVCLPFCLRRSSSCVIWNRAPDGRPYS